MFLKSQARDCQQPAHRCTPTLARLIVKAGDAVSIGDAIWLTTDEAWASIKERYRLRLNCHVTEDLAVLKTPLPFYPPYTNYPVADQRTPKGVDVQRGDPRAVTYCRRRKMPLQDFYALPVVSQQRRLRIGKQSILPIDHLSTVE